MTVVPDILDMKPPFDWSHPAAGELRRLLSVAYPSVDRGKIILSKARIGEEELPPREMLIVWQTAIELACRRGTLRALVAAVLADDQAEGVHDLLRGLPRASEESHPGESKPLGDAPVARISWKVLSLIACTVAVAAAVVIFATRPSPDEMRAPSPDTSRWTAESRTRAASVLTASYSMPAEARDLCEKAGMQLDAVDWSRPMATIWPEIIDRVAAEDLVRLLSGACDDNALEVARRAEACALLSWSEAHGDRLAALLADIYGQTGGAVALVESAKLPKEVINWEQANAGLLWRDIVRTAEKEEKVAALIEAALEDPRAADSHDLLFRDLHSLTPKTVSARPVVPPGHPSLRDRWRTGKVIRVRFLDGERDLHLRILDIGSEWTRYANLTFELVEAKPFDVTITFDAPFNSNGTFRSGEGIEKKVHVILGSVKPDTPEAEVRAVVLHEFGHVLGLPNEHQRHGAADLLGVDLDAVVSDASQLMHQYEVVRNGLPRKELDPTSIMMHAIPGKFMKDRKDRVRPSELSALDKEYIAKVYPR